MKPLVAEGLLTKVHGAVILPDYHTEPPFQHRPEEHRDAKVSIATALAKRIHDGDFLMIDTGTTTAYVARALSNHTNLVVVTNSVEIARTLATRNSNRVYMTGGELRADDGAAFGPVALEFLRQFHVDHAVLSIGAINEACAFMNFHLCEGEFSRAVIHQARQVTVVADRSKFGKRALIKTTSLAFACAALRSFWHGWPSACARPTGHTRAPYVPGTVFASISTAFTSWD